MMMIIIIMKPYIAMKELKQRQMNPMKLPLRVEPAIS